jgi:plastocyanin
MWENYRLGVRAWTDARTRAGAHDWVNEKESHMRYLFALAAGLAALAVAASAVASSTVQVTIRHQVRGCHSWAIGNGAYGASHSLKVKHGTTLTFRNNDVMPHTLVQLAGRNVGLGTPRMAHIGASTRVTLTKPGTYRFGTRAGEDYTSGIKTTGEDYVLRLTVTVT